MTGPRCALALLLLCIGLLNLTRAAAGATEIDRLDVNNPMSWLVKSICADRRDLVLPVDPYGGCPDGTKIRKIQSGDPLPYHNIEQMAYQQRDAYPLYNPVDGKIWIVATFDYLPFNRFNLFNGTDGYDIYQLQSGWAAIADTSDGGGYGQTFFGRNCSIGGWVLFPLADFLKGGMATIPIADTYWEQTGQSYPGSCPSRYSTDTLTSWKHQTGFPFGGVGGSPTKTMDTVISYHGFRSGDRFLRHGHLEIFYFTREYGITRWEVWTPTQQNPTPTTECNGPANETYQGVSFVVQFCHDWSRVTLAAVPELPVWPIPNTNLLVKPHFDGAIFPVWSSEGKSAAGNPIRWSVHNSTTHPDTWASPIGVRYLRLDCGAGPDGRCDNDLTEAMYQDLPVGKFEAGGHYAFGINARTESAQGNITVAVQQIDRDGRVISTDSTASATVFPDNGSAEHEGREEASSVYLSAAFVYNIFTITPRANSAKIRFLISPRSPQAFDVLDAWLAAWPAPAGFGATP